MSRQVSNARKIIYYTGMLLIFIGIILFLSKFVFIFSNLSGETFKESDLNSSFIRAVIGILLIFIGSALRTMGKGGLAGSGFELNPEKERADLEPFSRMKGGMLKDALEEANIDLGNNRNRVIMIRCTACKKLNEEDSKFCQECGKAI
ncbi:zinc ribbon domain-containing protein [Aliikangiella marina]|uniref:Zinc ribbon domain-containing protein n=1 Tax=Aliikangiella marina TaxID=1712262 RepID=A0A545TH59_9GAMM|nr:zinc ribbon domain-containing protein [Aliikangiella marina]TQV76567.1 zinc ribbon domain-containing protein [Aliikangiella marina]